MTDEVLGVAFSSRAGFPVDELGRLSAAAEHAGFDAVHVSERSSDALALVQVMAVATERIQVGTSIANIHLRHPGQMALAAATVDEVSEGRLVLGLGTGHPRYNREALGLDVPPPLTGMEEYVEVLRRALSGEPVDFDGEVFQLHGFELHRPPIRGHVPIHIGAILPGMLALAGRVADGAVFALQSPSWASKSTDSVRRAAHEAGRDPDDVEISCLIPSCITDDPDVALASARQVVAGYSMHPSAGRLFEDMGHSEALAVVAEAMGRGDLEAAARSVPPELAKQLVIHGPAGHSREQLAAFREGGVDVPILFPMPLVDGGWRGSVDGALRAFGR